MGKASWNKETELKGIHLFQQQPTGYSFWRQELKLSYHVCPLSRILNNYLPFLCMPAPELFTCLCHVNVYMYV